MAKYKRRPKVKRYRRSFYSRGMRIRKIVGIVALVAVVLAAAWFAAPHVLDWATHTWYTVVKDRDLEAESASRAAASSQAAASAAASEAASSAASEPEEDVFDGKAIVSGRWAELDTAALTDDDTLRTTAQQLKAQGVEYAVLTLKDAAGNIYYASQVAAAAGGIVAEPLDAGHIAAILREEKLIPVAQLAAFKDPISPAPTLHGHPLQRQRPVAGCPEERQPLAEPLFHGGSGVCGRPGRKRYSSWALSRWC